MRSPKSRGHIERQPYSCNLILQPAESLHSKWEYEIKLIASSPFKIGVNPFLRSEIAALVIRFPIHPFGETYQSQTILQILLQYFSYSQLFSLQIYFYCSNSILQLLKLNCSFFLAYFSVGNLVYHPLFLYHPFFVFFVWWVTISFSF